MAKRCTIWYDPQLDGYTLQCAYEPQFIEFLKQNIPASDRAFDPARKSWKFHKRFLDPVTKAAKKFFGDLEVSVLTEQQVKGSTVPRSASQSIDGALAEFMRLIPFDAANAAYRKAALAFHPDRGGMMEQMSKLNTLWNRIEKELYSKP